MRQEMIAAEIRSILKDFTITESPEDAVLLRGPGASPRSYLLKAGNVVFVPNGTVQGDPRLWEDPTQFNPQRYIIKDPKDEKREKVQWPRQLYSFGGGYSMCKGRLFAEREILTFVAALVIFWDIEYLGPKRADGSWKVRKGMEAGAPHPEGEVRVRLRRRRKEKTDGVVI